MSDEGYELSLSLDGRSEDFVLGVEMGRLWEQLNDPLPFEQTLHAANLEVVMRMMESTERPMRVEDTSDESWVLLVVDYG